MTVTALSPAKISNTGLPEEWKFIGSDGVIYRRFEFENYTATSAFLDRLAELSKEIGLYPDLSFAKTYVNVTVQQDDQAEDDLRDVFASRANEIIGE